jgi:hypothetical protein
MLITFSQLRKHGKCHLRAERTDFIELFEVIAASDENQLGRITPNRTAMQITIGGEAVKNNRKRGGACDTGPAKAMLDTFSQLRKHGKCHQ